jgi:uncharacterized membrane protein
MLQRLARCFALAGVAALTSGCLPIDLAPFEGRAHAVNDSGSSLGTLSKDPDHGSSVSVRFDGRGGWTEFPGCSAVAIANDGAIAGNCGLSAAGGTLVLWSPAGQPRVLTGEGLDSAVPTDMNNLGVIVGYNRDVLSEVHQHAWVYDTRTDRSEMLPELPLAIGSFARAINDRGDIIGTIRFSETMHGDLAEESKQVLWAATTHAITVLREPSECIPGAFFANDLNGTGTIVGSCARLGAASGGSAGLIWSPSTLVATVVENSPFVAINDRGDMTGVAVRSNSPSVWTASLRRVDAPVIGWPTAINNHGLIVGYRAVPRHDSEGTQPRTYPIQLQLL